jgi:hypothetical protein
MSEQEKIKELIKQEYIKCATSPIHFARKYCYISHPTRGRILFNLYPFQEKVLQTFDINSYTIINKSRQLGISTLVAMYSLWLMLFNKDKTILCIATKQETAKNMVTKVKYMYDNLPSWLRGNKMPLEDNKLSIKLANGSQIIAVSAASDAGRSYAVSLLIIDEAAFIEGIDKIYTSVMPTLATGGGCIALSSPNGVGNWFHRMFTASEVGENKFFPIVLPWDVHPDRNDKWFEAESSNMSPREIAQEYCCDFLASGNTVIEPEVLTFYEQTYVQDPIERRFMGNDFWIWQYPDYNRQYIVSADVARGDGSDYSAFHVIDSETCEQVAEYKSKIGTRDYGNMLVSVATEYNNAILIVENSNIGWDVIQTIVERGYPNLYYSPKTYNAELSLDRFLDKMNSNQTVPGFTNSTKTRPLVISKLEAYVREKTFIVRSKRLLEEMRVFVWLHGKAQAQEGYNDDLVMSAGFGMFIRDTSLKFFAQGMDLTKASLNNMNKVHGNEIIKNTTNHMPHNPYKLDLGNGRTEDLSWML